MRGCSKISHTGISMGVNPFAVIRLSESSGKNLKKSKVQIKNFELWKNSSCDFLKGDKIRRKKVTEVKAISVFSCPSYIRTWIRIRLLSNLRDIYYSHLDKNTKILSCYFFSINDTDQEVENRLGNVEYFWSKKLGKSTLRMQIRYVHC